MKNYNPILLISVATGLSLSTAAQTPFPPGTHVALAKPGMNNAPRAYTIYTGTNASSPAFSPGVTINPAHDINGIGLNLADNLLYGAAYVGNDNTVGNNVGVSLRRLGADGTMVDLGLLPATGNTVIEFPNFSAGTMGADGAYYYMTIGLKISGVIKYLSATGPGTLNLNANDIRMFLCKLNNVSALPANAGNNIAGGVSGYYELDFSHADITAAINAFLAQVNANYPDVYNADGGIQDFAINPVDTKIYGYISYPNGSNTVGRPVVMSAPVAGMSVITPVGTIVNTVPGQEVAGVQFDASGNFYGLFTTGHYAGIDLNSGALTGLTMSNIGTSGGNLRGDLAAAVTNIPFPAAIISFDGKNTGNSNMLEWVTASEQNCAAFHVERSNDGQYWNRVGYVNTQAPGGNSSSRLYYKFHDAGIPAGMAYYRLVQTDRDGRQHIYPGIVRLHGADAPAAVRLYPNPATGRLYIDGLAEGSGIRITDLAGKIWQQVMTPQSAGIDVSELPAGQYMLEISLNGVQQGVYKFVRQ